VPIVTGSKFEILFQPRALPNVRAERGYPANPREDRGFALLAGHNAFELLCRL
jgi:hypothetical protein